MTSRFDTRRRRSSLGLVLAAWLGVSSAGCAVAGRHYDGSPDPLSPAAGVSAPAALGAALREDPPLPGQTRAGWPAATGAGIDVNSNGPALARPTEDHHHGHAH